MEKFHFDPNPIRPSAQLEILIIMTLFDQYMLTNIYVNSRIKLMILN